MKRKVFALLLSCALLFGVTACSDDAGGSSGGSGGSAGRIVVMAGSTSVQPFAEVLAAEHERGGGSLVDVHGGGSGQGIASIRNGNADIGMSSRALRGDELELSFVTIARDGLALIVHPSNPIAGLSIEDIRAIYKREITDWGELGGTPGNIHVVTREEGSGTRGAFEEMVMRETQRSTVKHDVPVPPCEDCELCNTCSNSENERTIVFEREVSTITDHPIHARTIVLNTNGAIRQFVAGNPNAIGYISLGTVVICGLSPVKQLGVGGVSPFFRAVSERGIELFDESCSGSECCPAYEFNPAYSLSRPFVFIVGEEPTPEALAFIGYVLSDTGQNLLESHGLIKRSERDARGDSFVWEGV
ncbi:MAG: phosphate ABC transporter substrate-binding protein [Oscillospiraceae bacterium]|nr:phosphate ABC transporter substrate-binding protein [Oscillospiraceae bacterium]